MKMNINQSRNRITAAPVHDLFAGQKGIFFRWFFAGDCLILRDRSENTVPYDNTLFLYETEDPVRKPMLSG